MILDASKFIRGREVRDGLRKLRQCGNSRWVRAEGWENSKQEGFNDIDNSSFTGTPPKFLEGTMLRNGPGMFQIGNDMYKHWFDGLAYPQRYHFQDGKVEKREKLGIV